MLFCAVLQTIGLYAWRHFGIMNQRGIMHVTLLLRCEVREASGEGLFDEGE